MFRVILSIALENRAHEQCELLLSSFVALKLETMCYFYLKAHTETKHSLKCLDHQMRVVSSEEAKV